MRRRQLINAVGVGITTSIAGCFGSGGGGEGGFTGPSGAKETGRTYLEAYFNGEYEEARRYATGMKRAVMSKEAVAKTESRSPKITEIVNTKKGNGTAVVSAVTQYETALGSTSETVDLLLVKKEGRWKVTRSRSGFDGKNKPKEAKAFDATVKGPIYVAFAYTRQKGVGNDSAAKQYLAESYETDLPYITHEADTVNLQSISKDDSSAEVEVKAWGDYGNYGYVYDLIKNDGDWKIVSSERPS
jgi:hypothetical protein